MRTGRFLNLVLLTLLFGGSLLAWPNLPAEIPTSLGLGGTVRRWSETTLLNWFALPLSALGLTALIYLVGLLTTRSVRGINIPDKDRLLELPEHRQRTVLDETRAVFDLPCIQLTATLSMMQIAIYRVAHGSDGSSFLIGGLIFSVLSSPAIVIAVILRIQSAINRQVTLEREATVL